MATKVMIKKETVVIDVFGRIRDSRWRKKCENLIKQSRSRMYTQRIRKEAITTQSRADIAQLLISGEYDGALAKVEEHHQNECLLSAYGQIEKFCDIVHANIDDISSRKRLAHEVVEAVSSLVYAASRCAELPELHQMRNLIKKHFGADFEKKSVKLLEGNYVNNVIKYSLGNKSLSDDEKVKMISALARECKISLKPDQISVEKPVPQYESLDTNGEDQQSQASKIKAKFSKTGLKFSVFDPGSLMRMCSGNNDLSSQGHDDSIKTNRVYGELDGSRQRNKMNDQTMLMKLGRRLSRPKTHSRRGLLRNEDSDSKSSNAHPKLPDYDVLVATLSEYKESNNSLDPKLPDYDVLVATLSEYKESNTSDRTTRKGNRRF